MGGIAPEQQKRLVEQHLRLYNLFGDPSAPLRCPPGQIQMEAEVQEGGFYVQGWVDGPEAQTVRIFLEPERDVILGELEPVDPQDPDPATVRANWGVAMDKIIEEWELELEEGGRFEFLLEFEPLSGQRYYLRASAEDAETDAIGSLRLQ